MATTPAQGKDEGDVASSSCRPRTQGNEKDKHEEDGEDEGDNTPLQAKDEDDGASSSSLFTGGAASRPGQVRQRGRGRQRVARVNG